MLTGLFYGGMMDATSITVSLPTELLRDAEQIAQERKVSLDTLMAETLTRLIEAEKEYAAAKADYFAILEQELDSGSYGQQIGSRDDLHERN
jgi:hypothetical protein